MPVLELLRISITVADLGGAASFYADALGFMPGDETVIDDPAWMRLMGLGATAAARARTLRLGAQEIELIDFAPAGRSYSKPRSANDRWFQHIAIVVDDIDAVWARLQQMPAAGITVGGPQHLPANTGGVTAYKFRDPEGHPLELLRFPPGVGAAAWHARAGARTLGYDHSAIVVGDIARSLAFYTGLLGMRIGGRSLNRGVEQERLDGLVDDTVQVVALKPTAVPTPHLELLGYLPPSEHAAIGEIRADDVESTRQVLRVDELDGLVSRLHEAAVAFVSPGAVTLRDGRRAASVRDPDGHMIVLVA